jgi:hypothetical protein
VSAGGIVSDEEDADDDVLVPSHLEVMSAIQTITNYVPAASASSFDTVYKLDNIHRQKKSKQCKISNYFWKIVKTHKMKCCIYF